MIKDFRIETPEQLALLASTKYCRYGGAAVRNFATEWSASRKRKGGSPWDYSLYLRFIARGFGLRKAYIMLNGVDIAMMRYIPTLLFAHWKLKQIEDEYGEL